MTLTECLLTIIAVTLFATAVRDITRPTVTGVSFDGTTMWIVYSNGEVRYTQPNERPHYGPFQKDGVKP